MSCLKRRSGEFINEDDGLKAEMNSLDSDS